MNKKKIIIITVACVVCLVLGGFNPDLFYTMEYIGSKSGYSYGIVESAAEWWDCNWSYYKMITISHSMVASDQYNYPVLIYRGGDSDLAARAQDDGDDLVFVDSTHSVKLSHEIEYFNGSSGELVAWVNIPFLSSSSDTIIYLYYGNPDCGNQEDVQGTWNSNYVMVHHLEEVSGLFYDSTGYGNNGTVHGSVGRGVTGRVVLDGGVSLPGSYSSYIDFGNESSLAPSALTLEAWVKDPPVFTRSSVHIVDKKDEEVRVKPGSMLSVSRTIRVDQPSYVFFVALSSFGVGLYDMTVDDKYVYSGFYNAGSPSSRVERLIEGVRLVLPDKVRGLSNVYYSDLFFVDDEVKVDLLFSCLPMMPSDGRISYLVLTPDGLYDVECTTHWFSDNSFFSRLAPSLRGVLEKLLSVVREYEDSSSLWLPLEEVDDAVRVYPRLNTNVFWRDFSNRALWSLEAWDPGGRWVYMNDSLRSILVSRGDTARKLTLVYNASYPVVTDYRLTLRLGYPLFDYFYDEVFYTYEIHTMVDGRDVCILFNVSDLVGLDRVLLNHGISVEGDDEFFWFRIQQDDVAPGSCIELDPTYTVKTGALVDSLESTTQRKMARTSDGVLHCVFYESYSSKNNIRYAYSSSDDDSWVVVNVTQSDTYDQKSPSIAVDSKDNIHIVWMGQHAGSSTLYQIRYICYNSSSGVWSSIKNLTSSGYNQNFPCIVVDSSDKIHVVWYGRHGTLSANQIRYINSSNGGSTWSTAVNVTTDTYAQTYLSLAVNSSDGLHVVWQGRVSATYTATQIRYAYKSASSSSWSSPVNLTTNLNYIQSAPCIAVDSNDDLHVVWHGFPDANTVYNIRYKRCSGGSWGSIVNIGPSEDE
ncbi:MAG: DUF2341 domain-containing protein, partial [Candidatus Thermoplasmatota archaeon]